MWLNSFKFAFKNTPLSHPTCTLGLKVVLNIGQADYTELLGELAGARLVTHPRNEMPFPEDEGVSLRPGLLTSVSVKKARHTNNSIKNVVL